MPEAGRLGCAVVVAWVCRGLALEPAGGDRTAPRASVVTTRNTPRRYGHGGCEHTPDIAVVTRVADAPREDARRSTRLVANAVTRSADRVDGHHPEGEGDHGDDGHDPLRGVHVGELALHEHPDPARPRCSVANDRAGGRPSTSAARVGATSAAVGVSMSTSGSAGCTGCTSVDVAKSVIPTTRGDGRR